MNIGSYKVHASLNGLAVDENLPAEVDLYLAFGSYPIADLISSSSVVFQDSVSQVINIAGDTLAISMIESHAFIQHEAAAIIMAVIAILSSNTSLTLDRYLINDTFSHLCSFSLCGNIVITFLPLPAILFPR
jgi:hypothetical protein